MDIKFTAIVLLGCMCTPVGVHRQFKLHLSHCNRMSNFRVWHSCCIFGEPGCD